MVKNKTLYIFFVFTILSCIKSEKDLALYQQDIFNDIFPELLEKIVKDYRKIPIPPPPPQKNDSKEEMDKMKETFLKAKIANKIYLDTTKFAPLIIYINDTVKTVSKKSLEDIHKRRSNEFLGHSKSNIVGNDFKISLKLMQTDTENYILKYKSELKKSFQELKNNDLEKKRNKRQLGGVISISTIYFNQEKSIGVFITNFYCGDLCGCNFIVVVEKSKNKWIIKDLINKGCA